MKILFGIFIFACFSLDFIESRRGHQCPTPHLKHGTIKYKVRRKVVKYLCNPGYNLFGNILNYCNINTGTWENPPPKCVRPGCKDVSPPKNGSIFKSHLKAVLYFYCEPGFQLHGPNVTYCDGQTWSSNKPICLESNKKPALSCDFEEDDMCGWTHDLNHDFDWTRMRFNTPSGTIGTGPSHDHTLGNGKGGFYMYIESTSRIENDTARLVSPLYEKSAEPTCFVFYYHMYGSTIGTLRAYMRMENETGDLQSSMVFFEMKGNQGDRWIRAVHLFDGIPNNYQIIIEGVRGNGYVSDIAIDDVSIVNNCSLSQFEDQETTTMFEIEEYGTTDFLPDHFYSCEERCFSVQIQIGKHKQCACDENCYERNECCPDYIDMCLLHGSSDLSTETTFTIPPSTEESTSTTSKETTIKTSTTSKSTTTYRTLTTKTTRPTSIPKSDLTTQGTKTASTQIKQKQQTKQRSTTKEVTTENGIKETTMVEEVIDVLTEDQNLIPVWEVTSEFSEEMPNFPIDFAPIEDVAPLKRNSKEKIIVMKAEEEKGSTLPYYVLGILSVVGACLAFAVIRARRRGRSRRLRSGSQGGSASDVRFLTSDEILDLNLEYE